MVTIRKVMLFLVFFAFSALCAEEVQVSADNFFADENKLYSLLTGNVVVNKGKTDTLKADQIEIFFDADKQPIKYIAKGKVTFKILLKDKNYDGSGDEVIYEPLAEKYTINGNAYLHESGDDKKVYGDKIIADQSKGSYKVEAKQNSQIKMIFQTLNDKKQVENVVATADNFTYNEGAAKASLLGNAKVVKGKDDVLTSKEIVILFDANKQANKYIANGDAKFKIFMNDKHYNGKGNTLTYEPKKEFYTLQGNAFLEELEDKKQIYGDVITVDKIKGHYAVKSNKKAPVKLYFKVEGK